MSGLSDVVLIVIHRDDTHGPYVIYFSHYKNMHPSENAPLQNLLVGCRHCCKLDAGITVFYLLEDRKNQDRLSKAVRFVPSMRQV